MSRGRHPMIHAHIRAHFDRSRRRAHLNAVGLTDDDIGHISRAMGGAWWEHDAVLEAANLGIRPSDIPARVREAEHLARSSVWDGTVIDALGTIARVAVVADVPHAYASRLVADISRLAHGGTRP